MMCNRKGCGDANYFPTQMWHCDLCMQCGNSMFVLLGRMDDEVIFLNPCCPVKSRLDSDVLWIHMDGTLGS